MLAAARMRMAAKAGRGCAALLVLGSVVTGVDAA